MSFQCDEAKRKVIERVLVVVRDAAASLPPASAWVRVGPFSP